MKNTKFRRRALLSSVAMLLVALVALGSATFAWFTSSTTATAQGINVKTVQSSELQIASALRNDWNTLINYNTSNKILMPASSQNGTAWYTAEAGSKDSYAKKDGTNFTLLDDNDLDNYVFVNELNVRNKGAAKMKNVKITFTLNETKGGSGNYLRVALVPISGVGSTETLGAFNTTSVFDKDGAAYYPVASTTAASTTAITPSTTYSVNIGPLAAANGTTYDTKYYKLFVWFEGQDEDCKDINAGNEMPSISFKVTGETDNS